VHPTEREEWTMVRQGDRISLKSHFKTHLSSRWDPWDGYTLSKLRANDEMFKVQLSISGETALQGSNGNYMSANPDATMKQAENADAWEMWMVEEAPSGAYTLRSVHGHYLGATPPDTIGNVTHAYELDEWEVFTVDKAKGTKQPKVTIETAHGTYLAAHANPEITGTGMLSSYRASAWEHWEFIIPSSAQRVCLRSKEGRFVWAMEELPYHDGKLSRCLPSIKGPPFLHFLAFLFSHS
jgi:hypothetical protein